MVAVQGLDTATNPDCQLPFKTASYTQRLFQVYPPKGGFVTYFVTILTNFMPY
jgi:hypothetical protein